MISAPAHPRSLWVLALAALITQFAAPAAFAQAPNVAELAAYQGADRTERLVAGAKKEGTLTIYTSATVDDMAALTGAFQKKYGIKTSVWRASSENIIQRAATEARGNRFDVDVFETDGVAMEAVHREKLLQVVKSPYLGDLIPAAVPSHGEWIGDRLQIFTAAYNTNLVKKADLPKRYEDLLDPKWKGKLGVEAADYDWFSAVVSEMGEEKGLAFFRELVSKNGLSVRKGHTLLANLVVSGEVPLALTTYLYKVLQLKNDGAPTDWLALPPEVARSQGTGLSRRAPHPNAGILFMDFLLSDAQEILAKRDFIPTNIKVKPLPAGLTLKFVDPAKMLDENDKWEKLYKDIVTNQAR
ncbi:MAG: iron(III) transport system substrate-binding protein [Alphaproteobacteria bacterium]|jgi:iron(III) transport system substrate-binding protein|nr:iron(III) transport system substrate-binding protein [Alphaproteobacteria bacterium]